MKDSSVRNTPSVYQRDNVRDSKLIMLLNHEIQISNVWGPGRFEVRGIVSMIIKQYITQSLRRDVKIVHDNLHA